MEYVIGDGYGIEIFWIFVKTVFICNGFKMSKSFANQYTKKDALKYEGVFFPLIQTRRL